MESRLCILLISISALYFASATDQEAADVNAIVPESFVEEEPTTVKITRECFEKSCMHGQGHEECRMHKMPCAPSDKAQTPWAMFIEPQTKTPKLISLEATPGLVGVKMHKHEMDPDRAVKMPGVPAVAPPKLLKQMQEQDKLLRKIAKMENLMLKKDPNHVKSRQNWLDLEASVRHMEAGPEKLKSEGLLLKLAKEMSEKEAQEMQTSTNDPVAKSVPAKAAGAHDTQPELKGSPEAKKRVIQKTLVKKMRAAAQAQEAKDKGNPSALAKDKMAEAMAPAFVKQLLDGKALSPSASAPQGDTIDGIPVGHRKCFERACVSKLPDGSCGAAVITCGAQNGKAPKDTSKLSRAEALKMAKKSMGPMMPVAPAAAKTTLDQLKDVLKKHAKRSPALVDQLDETTI